jgi:recombinational DNA repair protein RecT
MTIMASKPIIDEHGNKFAELAIEIQSELSKPKRHGAACDIYLEHTNQICCDVPSARGM